MSERKTVFITGASRGIGHATATYFVQRGWRAITCSRDEVPPECPRDERHEHITVDLELTHAAAGHGRAAAQHPGRPAAARAGQQCRLLAQGRGRQAAGLPGQRHGGLACRPSPSTSSRPVYFSRACAPLLAESGGSIVNITSIAGHRVHPFAGSAYSTSKAALTGAHPRARGRPRASGHPRQRRLPRRDQHRHPLARHRGDRRAHPAQAAGLARRRSRPRSSICAARRPPTSPAPRSR